MHENQKFLGQVDEEQREECFSVVFFNIREAIAAIIGDIVVFTTRRGVLRFYSFLRLEEEY